MFTGLIEEIGRVSRVERGGNGIYLTIGAATVPGGALVGDSICINGACQTVTAVDPGAFTVFVSTVTASVTTLGSFSPGRRVNLERAMTPSSRFGGHFVLGHVDGRGRIELVDRDAMGVRVAVSAAPGMRRYIVDRGSVAVDGISLTVVSLSESGFSLYLIPETLGNTIATEWKRGDEANIEVDIIGKYVERMLGPREQGGGTGGGDSGLLRKMVEEGFA